MDLFDLFVRIGVDTSDYDKGAKDTEKSATGLKKVFDNLSDAVGKVGLKSEATAVQHESLSKQLKDAKSKVTELRAAYVKAASETGATSKQTEKLRAELKDAENQVESLRTELQKYPGTLQKAQSAARKFGSVLGTVGGVAAKGVGLAVTGLTTAATAAGAAVVALGKIGLDYNSQMETYTTNFEVMLGSTEAAAQKVEELKTMAAKTPFEMGDLAQATQTLLAFNVANEDTTGILTMLGDISLGNSQKLDSLTRAYGKMNAAQKVSLEDINMMIDAGFNPLLLVAEKTGESMADLYDRVSDGEVAVSEITDAMKQATSEGGQFYKGMEKASQTMQGLISTLADNAKALAGKIFEPISKSLTSTLLPAAIESVEELTTAFEEDGVEGLINAASKMVIGMLTAMVQRLPEFVNTALRIVQTLGAGINQNLPVLVDSAYQAFSAFAGGIVQMLPGLVDTALQIVSQLVDNILANLPQIIEAGATMLGTLVNTLIEHLPDIVATAIQIVGQLAGTIILHAPDILQAAINLGNAVVRGIIDGITALWQGLVDWFNGLWNSLFGGRDVNVNVNANATGVDGSHAGGMDYVPYNGYIARLHRGEAVLTAREAEDFRSGRSGSTGTAAGVAVYQTIYAAKQTPVELAATTRAYFQRARWAAPRRVRA